MSSEQETNSKYSLTRNINLDIRTDHYKAPGRGNINELLLKVREKKKQKKKDNIVFLGLVSSVVVITGIIASL